jgi:hypothetical protein
MQTQGLDHARGVRDLVRKVEEQTRMIIAKPATPGRWCDFSQFPTRAQALQLKARGYVGCFAYGPLPGVSDAQKAEDITAARMSMLTEEMGLEVGIVQHVRFGHGIGWDPRQHSGAVDASALIDHVSVFYPAGAHLWVDWEDLIAGLSPSAATVYLESWASTAIANEYRAGMYCGFDDPMSAAQRYELAGITSYWTDPGHRQVAVRGCSVVQGLEITVSGVRVDEDTVAADLLGELPWVAAYSSGADVA